MYTVAGGISSGVEAGAAIGFAILGMTIVGVPALVLLFLYCYHRRNDGQGCYRQSDNILRDIFLFYSLSVNFLFYSSICLFFKILILFILLFYLCTWWEYLASVSTSAVLAQSTNLNIVNSS